MFKLFGKPDNLRHAIFEGPHDYSKPMREAMYGFMTLHLKGEGSGDPIPEPKFTTEKPEALRCYPGDTRPKDFMTIPKFAAREAERLRASATPWKILDQEELMNASKFFFFLQARKIHQPESAKGDVEERANRDTHGGV
ncbi:MAG: hypothetical protein U0792_16660 [Gemmataceae bacterium]